MKKQRPLTNKAGEVRQLTAHDMAQARPAHEVLPKLIGAKASGELLRPRGRPPKSDPKALVTLRLDAEIIRHFKAGGAGWQTRINTALKRVVTKSR